MNAFFSGSVKVAASTFPLYFPANVHRSNGSDFDPHGDTKHLDLLNLEYFAKGYIDS